MTQFDKPSVAASLATFLRDEKAKTSPSQFAATSQALRLFTKLLRHQYKLSIHQIPLSNLKIDWGREYLLYLQATRSIETEHLYSRAILRFYEYSTMGHNQASDIESLAQFIANNRRPKTHTIPDIPLAALTAIINYAEAYFPPTNIEPNSRLYLQHLRDRAYILTLYETGLRLSEICNLRTQQLNLRQPQIELTPQLQLPISSNTAAALRTYLHHRHNSSTTSVPNHAPLFARHDKRAGTRYLPISRWTGANIVAFWVDQALDLLTREELQANAQAITANTLRHYFVQRTLGTEQPIGEVQTLARHRDIGTTRRYLKSLSTSSETANK